jgi:hypothetical protein
MQKSFAYCTHKKSRSLSKNQKLVTRNTWRIRQRRIILQKTLIILDHKGLNPKHVPIRNNNYYKTTTQFVSKSNNPTNPKYPPTNHVPFFLMISKKIRVPKNTFKKKIAPSSSILCFGQKILPTKFMFLATTMPCLTNSTLTEVGHVQ